MITEEEITALRAELERRDEQDVYFIDVLDRELVSDEYIERPDETGGENTLRTIRFIKRQFKRIRGIKE